MGSSVEDEPDWVPGKMDYCLWTTRQELTNAARTAFSSSVTDACHMSTRKMFAVVAVRVLSLLERLLRQTRVSMNDGLRVVATSRYEYLCDSCCVCVYIYEYIYILNMKIH